VKADEDEYLKIQVCWELNEDNRKRELGDFTLVDKYLKNGPNLLITMADIEQQHEIRGTIVKEVPLWQFLLDFDPNRKDS